MKASELKYHVSQTDSHFFDRSSMKFFGDTMANYGEKFCLSDATRPMTHKQACTFMSKLTNYPWRRVMLEEV